MNGLLLGPAILSDQNRNEINDNNYNYERYYLQQGDLDNSSGKTDLPIYNIL